MLEPHSGLRDVIWARSPCASKAHRQALPHHRNAAHESFELNGIRHEIKGKAMTLNMEYRNTSAFLALVSVLAGGVLTACSFSASTGASKSDVEAKSLETLQAQNPEEQIESVTCSDGLDAKVGATTTCELVGISGTYTFSATVDDVTDGVVHWMFSEPQPVE